MYFKVIVNRKNYFLYVGHVRGLELQHQLIILIIVPMQFSDYLLQEQPCANYFTNSILLPTK